MDAEPGRAPDRGPTLRPSPDGGALVSFGAVRPVTDLDAAFRSELALELLAGWGGSVLNVVLREELASAPTEVLRWIDR